MQPSSPRNTSRSHILLLAQPRTASHLLTQILGLDSQPQVHWDCDKSGIYVGTRRLAASLYHKRASEWTEEERSNMESNFQQCCDAFEEYRIAGETQGKSVFAKEHCDQLWNPAARYTRNGDAFDTDFVRVKVSGQTSCRETETPNPTVFPSEYLAMWQPIFLIRHPALMFPSYCRAMVEIYRIRGLYQDPEHLFGNLAESMSFSYTRHLYEWYLSYDPGSGRRTPTPIIVDADAMINSPEMIYDLAERLGLDKSRVQLSWSPRAEEAPSNDMRKTFLRTLDTSHCIQKNKTRLPLDDKGEIDGEEWKKEFGDRLGELVLSCVRAAMPDYEYLQRRAFTGN